MVAYVCVTAQQPKVHFRFNRRTIDIIQDLLEIEMWVPTCHVNVRSRIRELVADPGIPPRDGRMRVDRPWSALENIRRMQEAFAGDAY